MIKPAYTRLRLRRRGCRQTRRAGVHTHQRLNLSMLREDPRRTGQGLEPDSANPTVRELRPVRLVCSAGDRPAREKVRSPVVWMAEWWGVQNLESPEAHRQGLPWGDYESPGRNNSKRNVASKMRNSEGRARIRRAKAAWGAEIWPTRHSHLGGVEATAR